LFSIICNRHSFKYWFYYSFYFYLDFCFYCIASIFINSICVRSFLIMCLFISLYRYSILSFWILDLSIPKCCRISLLSSIFYILLSWISTYSIIGWLSIIYSFYLLFYSSFYLLFYSSFYLLFYSSFYLLFYSSFYLLLYSLFVLWILGFPINYWF